MKRLLATVAAAIGATVLLVGACGAAATHAQRPAPLTYICAVTPANSLPAACVAVSGPWNDWAGRRTPTRWDPCFGSATLIYLQACGPMSPTIRQWCTLNFDHHYMGTDICHNRGQKIAR